MPRNAGSMTNTTTFGRRAAPGMRPPREAIAAARDARPPADPVDANPSAHEPFVDSELEAWTKDRHRRRLRRLPWQQTLLVGSLSFFIASFVLPASVSGPIDRGLDVLSALGLLAWFAARRNRAREAANKH